MEGDLSGNSEARLFRWSAKQPRTIPPTDPTECLLVHFLFLSL